ncbi:nuclease-related domain-containing protein [Paenibacillus hodogayensis]|uniref:Nuclease-related domain-containing protein n=1 Tax=Paenibacillus hodogayensis TaxID=279208 RepID=A0ABV5VWY7_9BACL
MKLYIYVVVFFIVYKYVMPFLRLSFENMHIRVNLKKLNHKNYRIIQNVSLPEYHVHKLKNGEMVPYSATGQNLFIDYLIVSKYGIFLIKLLNLKHRFSGLKGREHGENWTWTRFSSIRLPLVPGLGDTHIKVRNPLIEAQLFSVSLKKHVHPIEKRIPFHPIVIIIPKIKTANLYNNQADVTFYHSLLRMIEQYKDVALNDDEIDNIYQNIMKVCK